MDTGACLGFVTASGGDVRADANIRARTRAFEHALNDACYKVTERYVGGFKRSKYVGDIYIYMTYLRLPTRIML